MLNQKYGIQNILTLTSENSKKKRYSFEEGYKMNQTYWLWFYLAYLTLTAISKRISFNFYNELEWNREHILLRLSICSFFTESEMQEVGIKLNFICPSSSFAVVVPWFCWIFSLVISLSISTSYYKYKNPYLIRYCFQS